MCISKTNTHTFGALCSAASMSIPADTSALRRFCRSIMTAHDTRYTTPDETRRLNRCTRLHRNASTSYICIRGPYIGYVMTGVHCIRGYQHHSTKDNAQA